VIQASQRTFAGLGVKDDAPMPSLRSYGEIAAILTDRDGSNVSEEQVRQICGAAERKIARALWNDPVVWMLLTSRCSAQSLVDSNTAHDKADDRQARPVRDHPSARDERVMELLPQEPAQVSREANGAPTDIPHGKEAADRV
jgi:hypothetical protein